jgi:DnaK suppressor protein
VDDLTPEQAEELNTDLASLREELRQLVEASSDGARPVDLDQPIGRLSRMDAMQQQSMVQANRRAAQQRLQQVDSAQRRFAEDDYGACLECGEAVGYARLKVQPEAPLCVACQTRREARRGRG